MALYLLLRGGYGWKVILAYALAGWRGVTLLHVRRIIAVMWYPSILFP